MSESHDVQSVLSRNSAREKSIVVGSGLGKMDSSTGFVLYDWRKVEVDVSGMEGPSQLDSVQ